MKLENGTDFSAAWIPGRLQYPAHSLTVIVKATYDLSDDGTLTPAEEQIPLGPELEEDGAEGGAICYDLDLVECKPRADRLLVGKCHTPDGRPVTECQVGFSVGSWQRRLRVVGDRTWKKSLLKTKATDPLPFTEMDISYTRAYGGPRFAANPAGRGFYKGKPQGDREILLPNIEDPAHPIKSPSDLVAPASFGPIARPWPPRRNLIGTYGKAWFKSRAPWFPEDIDWGVNNATPICGQTEGYLRGDEPFVLENLFAQRSRVEGQLPGLRVRAIIERLGSNGTTAEEVPLNLDTLWIDTEDGKLVLIWRGACPVESEEFEDLATLILVPETLQGTPSSVETLMTPLQTRRAEEVAAAAAEQAEQESDEASDQEESDEAEGPGESEAEMEAHRLDQIKMLQKSLNRLPSGADALPEQVEAREELLRVIAMLEAPAPADSPPPAPIVWSRETVIATLAALRAGDGEAGAASDLESDPPAVDLADVGLAGADLSGLDLSELDFSALDLSRTRFDGANLARSSFAEADLTDISALRVEATGADFTAASGSGARFCEAKLAETNFSAASMSGSDFSGADFSRADLGAADFVESQFQKSKLDRVRAEGADFTGAALDGSTATRAHFEGASFDGASLTEVQLSASFLSEASCEESSWNRAQLFQCDLTKTNFASADLTSIVITSARADEADFVRARLDGAKFLESDLDEANFTRALLSQTDLTATSLRKANFRRAQIENSTFRDANLFEALFPAAKLERVDFRGSNLYGADLTEVKARELRIEGAIVKQTRLDPN